MFEFNKILIMVLTTFLLIGIVGIYNFILFSLVKSKNKKLRKELQLTVEKFRKNSI